MQKIRKFATKYTLHFNFGHKKDFQADRDNGDRFSG